MTKTPLDQKIALRMSTTELSRIIVALLNNMLNKKFFQNVRLLFDKFNESSFKNDADKDAAVFLINKIVDTTLSQNLGSKDILLNTIDVSGRYYAKATELLNMLYDSPMSVEEASQVDAKISQLLKFATVEVKADELVNHINAIKSETYDNLDDEIAAVEDGVNIINHDFKVYKEAIEDANDTVSLSSELFLDTISKIIDEENNPASRIRTGIKLLNEILDGGWQRGRVYCALGILKGWKSGFLLNSAIWAKRYNKLMTKDSTKTPVILYLTMENSKKETVQRMISHCKDNNFDVRNKTPQEVARIFEENNLFTPNDSSSGELVIMYKKNKSMSVDDIDALLDEFEKNGKEVVFLVIDYLKRIKATRPNKELRLELSSIADDLHALAVERDIPILTAMQMNRNAISELENATNIEQKIQAVNRIGASNVGESIDILQNIDVAFSIARTIDPHIGNNGEIEYTDKFVNIRLVANRCKNVSDIDSFAHRFAQNNDMKLMEDANAEHSISIIDTKQIIGDRIKDNGVKTRGNRHAGN